MIEKSIIVDKNDNPIGAKERNLIEESDIYRVSALWIVNSKNQVLLAKRNIHKKNDPGKWGPAVTGTVEEGETYRENIIKETKKELGINLEKNLLKKIHKIRIFGKHNLFCQWYLFHIDMGIDDFVLQEGEVDEIAWVDKDILEKDLTNYPEKYTSSLLGNFEVLKKY